MLALFSKRCRLVAIAICNAVKLIIFCASTVAIEEHFAQVMHMSRYGTIYIHTYNEINEFAISVLAVSFNVDGEC